MSKKYKFQGTASKAEVHISSGALGMEFFLEKTFPNLTRRELAWIGPGASCSPNSIHVLADCYKTTWLAVLHDHFPELLKAKTNVTAPE